MVEAQAKARGAAQGGGGITGRGVTAQGGRAAQGGAAQGAGALQAGLSLSIAVSHAWCAGADEYQAHPHDDEPQYHSGVF